MLTGRLSPSEALLEFVMRIGYLAKTTVVALNIVMMLPVTVFAFEDSDCVQLKTVDN